MDSKSLILVSLAVSMLLALKAFSVMFMLVGDIAAAAIIALFRYSLTERTWNGLCGFWLALKVRSVVYAWGLYGSDAMKCLMLEFDALLTGGPVTMIHLLALRPVILAVLLLYGNFWLPRRVSLAYRRVGLYESIEKRLGVLHGGYNID